MIERFEGDVDVRTAEQCAEARKQRDAIGKMFDFMAYLDERILHAPGMRAMLFATFVMGAAVRQRLFVEKALLTGFSYREVTVMLTRREAA